MNSNLNDLLSDNTQLITGLSNIFDLTFTPGTIKTFNEQFSFTYTPEFMDWLGPRFSYNPRYSWTRDLGNNIEPTADLRSENDFSATFTLSVQKFIENFYSSESSSKSSSSSSRRSSNRRSSSRNSSASSKHKPFEIDNPYAKTLLKFLYTISQ